MNNQIKENPKLVRTNCDEVEGTLFPVNGEDCRECLSLDSLESGENVCLPGSASSQHEHLHSTGTDENCMVAIMLSKKPDMPCEEVSKKINTMIDILQLAEQSNIKVAMIVLNTEISN